VFGLLGGGERALLRERGEVARLGGGDRVRVVDGSVSW